jgi:hypothetical protein
LALNQHTRKKETMAIKVKSKKPPQGTRHPPRKKRHEKKERARTRKAAPKHAKSTKTLLARKPKHVAPAKPLLATKPKQQREFVVAAESVAGASLPLKKKKKKHQMVLRFTENTLKDIAALECVRRCFN